MRPGLPHLQTRGPTGSEAEGQPRRFQVFLPSSSPPRGSNCQDTAPCANRGGGTTGHLAQRLAEAGPHLFPHLPPHPQDLGKT